MSTITSNQSLFSLLTVTYEENAVVSGNTSRRSSVITASNKTAVRTCLKRYEMNDRYLRTLFEAEEEALPIHESLHLITTPKND